MTYHPLLSSQALAHSKNGQLHCIVSDLIYRLFQFIILTSLSEITCVQDVYLQIGYIIMCMFTDTKVGTFVSRIFKILLFHFDCNLHVLLLLLFSHFFTPYKSCGKYSKIEGLACQTNLAGFKSIILLQHKRYIANNV